MDSELQVDYIANLLDTWQDTLLKPKRVKKSKIKDFEKGFRSNAVH